MVRGHYVAGVIARRVVAVFVAWVAVLGLARGVVALPERCPPATEAQIRAAAGEAVGWFERNQGSDGRWLYRYDRDEDLTDRRSHVVRQAGITLSLYQADAAGLDGALAPADAGVDWLLGETVAHDDWVAVRRDALAPTGGSALLLAALATRRDATGDARYDDEMAALGRFLVAMTEPSGAVGANWDITARRPVPGDYSVFFTGEAYFALAALDMVDPAGGWGATADRIGRYLATERDAAEDLFPPTSDHWAAYGLAATAAARPLDDDEAAYAERLAGVFSVEVRFESQRTDGGLNRWALRGPRVLGAGLGTIGEGLGALWAVAGVDDRLGSERAAIAERTACVAGMLVDRQVDEVEAGEAGRPGMARGAWFHHGVTQMDDQQHSLSALLLAEPVVRETGGRQAGAASDDPVSAARALWLAVVALAVVNPARVRRLAGRLPVGAAAGGSLVAGAAVAVTAALAGPLLRAADVSPATALVAAGIVVVVTAVVDGVRRPADMSPATGPGDGALVPLAVPALVRPAVVVLAVAVAADAGLAVGVGTAVAVAAAGAATLLPERRPAGAQGGPALGDVARWAFVAVAVLGGIDLAAHGVFSV